MREREKRRRETGTESKDRKQQSQYQMACIVADSSQHALATASLDEVHGPPKDLNFDATSNENRYTWGRLAGHDVVIVSPPDGPRPRKFGETVTLMLAPIPQIRFHLVAQIGSRSGETESPNSTLGDIRPLPSSFHDHDTDAGSLGSIDDNGDTIWDDLDTWRDQDDTPETSLDPDDDWRKHDPIHRPRNRNYAPNSSSTIGFPEQREGFRTGHQNSSKLLSILEGKVPTSKSGQRKGAQKVASGIHRVQVEHQISFVTGIRSGSVFYAKAKDNVEVVFHQLKLRIPELRCHLPVFAHDCGISAIQEVMGAGNHAKMYRTIKVSEDGSHEDKKLHRMEIPDPEVATEQRKDPQSPGRQIKRSKNPDLKDHWSNCTIETGRHIKDAEKMMTQLRNLFWEAERNLSDQLTDYSTIRYRDIRPLSLPLQAFFVVDWNASEYLNKQYSKLSENSLATVNAITGSLNSATVTTTAEFLERRHPTVVLQALSKSTEAAPENNQAEDLESYIVRMSSDYCRGVVAEDVVIKSRPGQTLVHISGNAYFVQSVVYQLSWIGSALRSSPTASIAQCSPFFSHIGLADPSENDNLAAYGFSRSTWDICGRISFSVETAPDQDLLKSQEGTCWHGLFRNQVVVRGFSHSNHGQLGLSIPLHLMVERLGTSRATEIEGSLLIKSFSAILFPTRLVDDTMTWHLILNQDGSYISYLDQRIQRLQAAQSKKIMLADLSRATKHVLGWCAKATSRAGKRSDNERLNETREMTDLHQGLRMPSFLSSTQGATRRRREQRLKASAFLVGSTSLLRLRSFLTSETLR